jgi:hypothetical protein
MGKRKPELVAVKLVEWYPRRGIYGIVTEFDDGFCYHEPWGSYDDTFNMVRIRSGDIRGKLQQPPRAIRKQV